MEKNFLSINIPKLPVCTTEQAIEIIKKNIKNLNEWKDITNIIPQNLKKIKNIKNLAYAGFFSASLELTKEGLLVLCKKKILIKF